MEPDYSNREIREFFKDIKEVLMRIEQQTIKTNGRVTTLEKGHNVSYGWIKGITVSFGFIVVVLIPVMVYAYNLSQQNQTLVFDGKLSDTESKVSLFEKQLNSALSSFRSSPKY